MVRLFVLALVLAVAGCAQPPAAPDDAPVAGPIVEGWIVDERFVPVGNVSVSLAGFGVQTASDPSGYYRLDAPRGADLLVVTQADGFRPQTRSVGAQSGERHLVNFTLERIPDAEPFHVVTTHTGTVRCGVVAIVAEDQSRPHEHQGVRCSQLLNDTSNQWTYTLPSNTTGVVMEVAWTPQSEVAQALVLKVIVAGTGDVLAFIEGTSILRIQLSSVNLAQAAAAGHTELRVTLEPGAGTGNHEHGAAGAFFEQPFDVYATAFFNGPVDASYSIERPNGT